MARPLRRVLIRLSIRLGLSIREVETWTTQTIREHLSVLISENNDTNQQAFEQTPEQMVEAFGNLLGKPKE